ncbi:MAG TPA: SIMPL domain-containing protein [Acidimicrobiales bacterium]
MVSTAVVAAVGLGAAGCSAARRTARAPEVQFTRAATSPSSTDASQGITAHGLGRVSGTPDVLTLSIGVDVDAGRATDALSQSSQRAQAVIDSLKQHGVADKDIQTSQLSLWAQYGNGASPVITGYHASDVLTAKLRKLDQAGAAIDAAVASAGNDGRLEGVQFGIDDQSPLKAAARTEAVQRAHDQAAQLAQAAGVKLGALRSLTETAADQGPIMAASAGTSGRAGVGAPGGVVSAPVPIQPGSQELDVEVVAVYDVG